MLRQWQERFSVILVLFLRYDMISSIAFRYATEKNLEMRLKICIIIQCDSLLCFQLTTMRAHRLKCRCRCTPYMK